MLKILLVTTHNLATNPRLVKELNLFIQQGYKVNVVCFEFDNRSKKANDTILSQVKNAGFLIIPGGRKPFTPWLKSTVVQQVSKIFLLLFPGNTRLISYSIFKTSYLLKKALSNHHEKYDWIIAHNPGSFWVSNWYAQKHSIKLGIDMEDYHPGETGNIRVSKRLKVLISNTCRFASYISAASPLIMDHTLNDLQFFSGRQAVIMNSFSINEFECPVNIDGKKIQLVWFSQHINGGRGLEQLVVVLAKYQHLFDLHLYGNMDKDFFNQYLQQLNNIQYHGNVLQSELHNALSRFDVGLAIEPGKDENNRIALSNKILAYAQAGLYILASDTLAQIKFMDSFPEGGFLTPLIPVRIEESLLHIQGQILEIRKLKQQRYRNASALGWENESLKLLRLMD